MDAVRGFGHRLTGAIQSPVVIGLVALALRTVFALDFVLQNSRRALATIPFLFEPGYIAAALATGQGFSSPLRVPTGPTAWSAPVYPLLLAVLFRLFGLYHYRTFLAALTLNLCFSAGTAVVIARIGRELGAPALGSLAAWIWVLFPNSILIAFEDLCWEACLAALLTSVVLLWTLRLPWQDRWSAWSRYGGLWGLVLLTNPTLGSAYPFLLGWAVGHSPRRKIARLSLAVATTLLCCLPWVVRNAIVFHRFIPIRSTLGLQLWLGNNEQARPLWLGTLHPIFNSVERERYIQQGEIAYMDAKLQAALAYMRAHPRRVLTLAARRFVAFWSGGTPSPPRDWQHNHSHWFRYVLGFNLLLALLGAGGLLRLWASRAPARVPLSVLPLIFPFAYYFTLVIPRYRLPADPSVVLLAACCLIRPPASLDRQKKNPAGCQPSASVV